MMMQNWFLSSNIKAPQKTQHTRDEKGKDSQPPSLLQRGCIEIQDSEKFIHKVIISVLTWHKTKLKKHGPDTKLEYYRL